MLSLIRNALVIVSLHSDYILTCFGTSCGLKKCSVQAQVRLLW